jgi:hypothetical protein
MLEIQMNSFGAKDKLAMLMEVKNYLKCEMQVKPSVIEQLDIVKVFHPAKDDGITLYVELGHELEVDLLDTYTKHIMKKDHRVFPYIPKEMYRSYRGAESYMYSIRQKVRQGAMKKVCRVERYWPMVSSCPSSSI